MTRKYSDLSKLGTIEERYDYLRVQSQVGLATFGFERWLNQRFYRSTEWRNVRHAVIARDNGCDLGVPGYEVVHQILIHHMNPITAGEVIKHEADLIDPEFLISCSLITHNAIHYGSALLLPKKYTPRRPGDTKLW